MAFAKLSHGLGFAKGPPLAGAEKAIFEEATHNKPLSRRWRQIFRFRRLGVVERAGGLLRGGAAEGWRNERPLLKPAILDLAMSAYPLNIYTLLI